MNNRRFWLIAVGLMLLLTFVYLWPTIRLLTTSAGTTAAEQEARQDLQEKALKLGLDLRGGMAVTMEVRVDELVRALASNTDAAFDAALATAQREGQTSSEPFVDLFVRAFEARDANVRLARYFRSESGGVTRNSSNADVRTYLQAQADDAVGRAIEIVRQRVDRFGVAEPSIVKKGSQRIAVELPGVSDADRVRRLLRGTARLEFRLMADPEALGRSLSNIIQFYNGRTDTARAATPPVAAAAPADAARTDRARATADTAATVAAALAGADSAGRVAAATDTTRRDTSAAAGANNPLLRVLTPLGQSVQFGTVAVRDTAVANRLLNRPEVRALLPAGVRLLYGSRPATEDGSQLVLLGVRDRVELTGDVLTEASVQFDPNTNAAEVSMTMDSDGAGVWSRLTGANVNKPVAIVLDDYVVSYPNVINRITGGRSSITGLDSREEADDIVTVLKSGSLPAPVQIIEERTVGPSLGAESVRAGLISLLIGFLGVAAFIVWVYRGAGVVAVVALAFNLLFLFGVMAGFKATLTLPGIAGIVLTLGMAVDANVLIFERIREELRHGQPFREALKKGFDRALSAILDSNITTFLTGAILYSFGVGPIQGFAVTLMAGIVTSLFSALVVTRLLLDYLVNERGQTVSVG